MDVDRVSSLPDTTLSQILSYLDTDEAVRTKILSKQWQHLWFPTQQLVFRQPCQKGTDMYLTRIADFIDRTLPLDTCPKITRFELRLKQAAKHFNKSKLNLGIKASILRGVRDVILDHRGPTRSGSYSYTLPKKLLSYAPLESLTLRRHCGISPSSNICWTSLKTLTIEFAYIVDDVINNVLQSCHKLEHLELHQCHWFKTIIDGDASCMRKLVIRCHQSVVISMPKIECLIIKNGTSVINVSSLVDVVVDFQSFETDPYTTEVDSLYSMKKKDLANDWLLRDENDHLEFDRSHILIQFLNKVDHAERLQLGTWCVKAKSSYAMRGTVPVIIIKMEMSRPANAFRRMGYLWNYNPFKELTGFGDASYRLNCWDWL